MKSCMQSCDVCKTNRQFCHRKLNRIMDINICLTEYSIHYTVILYGHHNISLAKMIDHRNRNFN